VGILWFIAVLGKLIFRKDAMGMGDVKLMGAIGAYLGWPSVLFTLMVSSFLGAIVGVSLVLTGKKEMQSRIPFGPYIALAALIWMFWGPGIWNAYINWLLPPQPM
jgi:leader peptidase (prepilin peptidase)/N-methyltransferase